MTSLVDVWETAEGKRCADCAHRVDREDKTVPPLNLCSRHHRRACLMIRSPGFPCGPDARHWGRKR